MILDEIVNSKKEELEKVKKQKPLKHLQQLIQGLPEPKNFAAALTQPPANRTRIIAEVKKASPSKGIICDNFSPVRIAGQYEQYGAVAVSVLTEKEYFKGSLEHLKAIKSEISVPVLRKDFIIDPYQIYEAKAYGADAVLLIAALLLKEKLKEFLQLCSILSLYHLVEIHNRRELEMALEAGATVIGINNRNLQTFQTDCKTTLKLMKAMPKGKVVVSESGISGRADIVQLKEAGVDAFLIGEALMRAENPGLRLKELLD